MRLNVKLLAVALAAAAPVLASPPAFAGDDRPVSQQIPMGISTQIISLSMALQMGIVLTPDPYLALGSQACGALKVKASSTCEVIADANCVASCDPMNFATSAYNECAEACDAPAGASCKTDCSPGCQNTCLGDCNFDPVVACDGNCSSTCGATCADKVASGAVKDQVACEIACSSTCGTMCADAAGAGEIDNCGVQCGASCTSQCEAAASMDCHIGCQVEIFDSLATSCKEGCAATGSLFCDGQFVDGITSLEECIGVLVANGVSVKQD
jgi:hypothetical protein